jgi:hypothetical protein
MYFKLQKFTSQNLVNQAAVFYVRNALKVVYEHLRFENFSGCCTPGPPLKGEGGHGERKEGRDGKEVVSVCVCAIKHIFRQFTFCCVFIFAVLATSVHINGT